MLHAPEAASDHDNGAIYANGRFIHDADAHIYEPDGFYENYADEATRRALKDLARGSGGRDYEEIVTPIVEAQEQPEDGLSVLANKNFAAWGAFEAADRVRALDLLGFASQLIFPTSFLRLLTDTDRSGDPALAAGVARAHNRGMVEFCSGDPRLLPACWVPINHIPTAIEIARESIDAGAAALLLPSICPIEHGPSHVGFEPLWAMAAEAGLPIVYHVGGGRPMDETFKVNGLPPVKDFAGGDGNFTSISFMAIPEAPMQTMATLIIDGVLDRHPTLKFGIIEQGAHWLPGWMRSLDSAADAFLKNEERLKSLSAKPSEIVARQVRVTPYPHEDVRWIIEQSSPDICMFSSDYPHIEGGRQPLRRFDASLEGASEDAIENFYWKNFADLMGPQLRSVGS